MYLCLAVPSERIMEVNTNKYECIELRCALYTCKTKHFLIGLPPLNASHTR